MTEKQHARNSAYSRLKALLAGTVLLLIPFVTNADIITISVSGPGTVTGNFNIFCEGIPSGEGSNSCQAIVDQGQTLDLVATPDPGFVFAGWGGSCISSGFGPCSYTSQGGGSSSVNPDIDIFVSANFVPAEFSLNVSTAGEGSGLVQSDSQHPGIFCPDDCSENYASGSTITLTATADSGSLFAGWSGAGCSGTGNCLVSLDNNQIVLATFELAGGGGSGDADGDGVPDGMDQCPGTPTGEAVDLNGCSQSQLDDDGDGVNNALDQCPNTPTGAEVDANGCSAAQLDTDGDGVSNSADQCPNTPAGDTVDANGCSPGQLDADGDGVPDATDQCPDTLAGETVDASGCSQSQLDLDGDGVLNTTDQCPNTPAGEQVDAVGCSDSQGDDDTDGVQNGADQCPATPAGETADQVGCGASQLDGDSDGVTNDIDQCANTPAGEEVDGIGCAESQLDSDADLVSDAVDQCPNTAAGADVDEVGCSFSQQTNDLAQLPGLTPTQRTLGGRIDDVCERIGSATGPELSSGQQDLVVACNSLRSRATTDDQATDALGQIALNELGSQQDYAIEVSTAQYRQVASRMEAMRNGASGGISVTGLNFQAGDKNISADVLQSALTSLLGIGASADEQFSDFGRLGIFVQGDLKFGDRDNTSIESGYGFDSWNITAGADYRFTNDLYAGLSVSGGGVDMDFDNRGGGSDISSWALSAYGGWQLTDEWYVDGLLSYGSSNFDTLRNIRYTDSGGVVQSTHKGDTDGNQIFAGLNTGYMFNQGSWRFGPTASISYLDGDIDGFTERARGTDSDAWSWAVEDQAYESLRYSVGFQADYIINTSFGVLVPGVSASLIKETEASADRVSMRLANNPFAESILSSTQVAADFDDIDSSFLDVSVNLSGQFAYGVSGFISYQFYSAYDNYSQDGVAFGIRWDKSF